MTRRMIAALVVLASPLLALAQESRGSCEYTSDRPGAQELTFCTHAASESLCMAEAGRKASPEWLKAHQPRFNPDGDCTDGGKALKKATAQGAKGNAKRAQKSQKTKTQAAAEDVK